MKAAWFSMIDDAMEALREQDRTTGKGIWGIWSRVEIILIDTVFNGGIGFVRGRGIDSVSVVSDNCGRRCSRRKECC